MPVNFWSSLWTKQAREKPVPLKVRPLHSMKAWSILMSSWPRFSAWMRPFPSIKAAQSQKFIYCLSWETGKKKGRGYNLKGKRRHPFSTTLSISPQSTPWHTSAPISESGKGYSLLTAHVPGQAATALWRGWDVPKLWRTRLHGGWPAAFRQLGGSSCRQRGCAASGTAAPQHAKRKWGLLSPHCPAVGGSSCRLSTSVTLGKRGRPQ